jgi:hypothetical protein
MIVRVATEGQYELADDDVRALNELDSKTVQRCEADDEQAFRESFEKMLELVRSRGRRVPDEELVESDVILPPPDVTFEEAKAGFSGEGLIPE